jgi:tetratricopeptide (TPR) repeat protein
VLSAHNPSKLIWITVVGVVLMLLLTQATVLVASLFRNIGAIQLINAPAEKMPVVETWFQRSLSLHNTTSSQRLLGTAKQFQGDITTAVDVWRKAGLTLFAIDVGMLALPDSEPMDAALWESELLRLITTPVEWQQLGDALKQREEYDRAVDAYQQALAGAKMNLAPQVQPSIAEIHYSLADIYRNYVGDTQAAFGAYYAAVQSADFQNIWHHVLSYQQIAILLIGNDSQQALSAAQRAVELMPGDSLGHSILGLAIYAETQDLQVAEQEILKAIQIAPGNIWPRMHLGQLYLQAEEYQLAEGAYLEAARLHPNFTEANDMATHVRKTYLAE